MARKITAVSFRPHKPAREDSKIRPTPMAIGNRPAMLLLPMALGKKPMAKTVAPPRNRAATRLIQAEGDWVTVLNSLPNEGLADAGPVSFWRARSHHRTVMTRMRML
jgi:hypothetical protein